MASEQQPGPAPSPSASNRVAAGGPFGADGAVAARLAISSLLPLYPKAITRNGKLQPETLFCITGALAGFAAQYAVRQDMAATGGIDAHATAIAKVPGTPIDLAVLAGGVVVAQAPNGERYYFSDSINRLLMPERLDSMSAFSLLGGQAMRLGAARSDLPDCLAILQRAADTMGTPAFGAFATPAGHRPVMSSRQAVEIFWPATLTALTREPVVPVPGFKLLPPRLWPVALAAIAASYMETVKTALAPGLALVIFMEAALPISKIDQATVCFVRDVKQ